MNLVDYGIQNEHSDYRIHVCPLVYSVYLYATRAALTVIEWYPKRTARQIVNGRPVITAEGHIVPIDAIPNCQEVILPHDIWETYPITENQSTSVKGSIAVYITRAALLRGLIAIPLQTTIIEDRDLQIEGTDLIIQCRLKIQVKCDLRGGNKKMGGTGNLFLQTAEVNPLKMV